MRRLYVTKLDTALEAHGVKECGWNKMGHSLFHPSTGWHSIHLINYTDPANADLMHTNPSAWEQLPEVQEWIGAGKPILLSSAFDHSESSEDKWHEHPEVAVLPHPTFEGNDKIKDHVGKGVKKLKASHISALKKHSTLGFDENDTVLDLSRKAKAICSEVRVKYPV